jgi:hypothetical protein
MRTVFAPSPNAAPLIDNSLDGIKIHTRTEMSRSMILMCNRSTGPASGTVAEHMENFS